MGRLPAAWVHSSDSRRGWCSDRDIVIGTVSSTNRQDETMNRTIWLILVLTVLGGWMLWRTDKRWKPYRIRGIKYLWMTCICGYMWLWCGYDINTDNLQRRHHANSNHSKNMERPRGSLRMWQAPRQRSVVQVGEATISQDHHNINDQMVNHARRRSHLP
mgnify:CR=1 FL=1